jgi:Tol biopolymer transport system component
MFSPDGKRVLYQSFVAGDWLGLHVVNADGTGHRLLSSQFPKESMPAFSPDSKRVAFAAQANVDTDLFVINVDGTGLANLTNVAGIDGDPAWTPDGRTIVFTSQRNTDVDVYRVNADGTDQRNLTNNTAFDAMERLVLIP